MIKRLSRVLIIVISAALILCLMLFFLLGHPENLTRVHILGYTGNAMEPFVSSDGRFLFFNTDSSDDPARGKDIHYAVKVREDGFRYTGEVGGINTNAVEGTPTLDDSGNFYYVSTDTYDPAAGEYRTVHRGKFSGGSVTGPHLVPGDLDLGMNEPGRVVMDVEISPDGAYMVYARAFIDPKDGEKEWPEESNLIIAARTGDEFRVHPKSAILLGNVNTERHLEYAPAISRDLRTLYFTRLEMDRMGRPKRFLIMKSTRKSADDPFGDPQIIRAISKGFVEGPALSGDEAALYFHKKKGKRYLIYRYVLP